MGFLTSTFMKSYAIRMKLQAERNLMSINLRAGRVQRQMKNVQRMVKTQQRYQNMASQATLQASLAPLQRDLQAYQQAGDTANMNSIFSQMQNIQMKYSMEKQYNDGYWDEWMEAQLAPLQDEEESLQLEKTMAEQEKVFWDETLKSYSQQNKDDVKSVVPDVG